MSSRDFENARRLALALPRPERAKLAATLLASIDDPSNPTLEAAWAEAIERRIAEFDSGETGYIDAAEFISKTRLRLRQSARV